MSLCVNPDRTQYCGGLGHPFIHSHTLGIIRHTCHTPLVLRLCSGAEALGCICWWRGTCIKFALEPGSEGEERGMEQNSASSTKPWERCQGPRGLSGGILTWLTHPPHTFAAP